MLNYICVAFDLLFCMFFFSEVDVLHSDTDTTNFHLSGVSTYCYSIILPVYITSNFIKLNVNLKKHTQIACDIMLH
jgi:hypothetical protein